MGLSEDGDIWGYYMNLDSTSILIGIIDQPMDLGYRQGHQFNWDQSDHNTSDIIGQVSVISR